MVDGERLARVIHDDRGRTYELLEVTDAAVKWARVEGIAERTLVGAFAPLDEFVGMLWADAMEETFLLDPKHRKPPERGHFRPLNCVPRCGISLAATTLRVRHRHSRSQDDYDV